MTSPYRRNQRDIMDSPITRQMVALVDACDSKHDYLRCPILAECQARWDDTCGSQSAGPQYGGVALIRHFLKKHKKEG